MKYDNNLKLCFVKDNWAWFTTCSLKEQWADDWDDAPYEHNAGEPYYWDSYRKVEPYNIVKVAWDGPFCSPCEDLLNSPYSVEMINRGDIAWLRPDKSMDLKEAKPIPAGTSLEEFIKLIRLGNGEVYIVANSPE